MDCYLAEQVLAVTDVTDPTIVEDGAVVVDGTRVVWVGPRSDPRTDLGVLRDLRLVLARGTRFVPDELPSLELDDEARALRAAMLASAFDQPGQTRMAAVDLPESACEGAH